MLRSFSAKFPAIIEFYDIFFVELVLELTKSSGSVPESEDAQACISFSTTFAMNFNIDVSTIFSSNATVLPIGEHSLLKFRSDYWFSTCYI